MTASATPRAPRVERRLAWAYVSAADAAEGAPRTPASALARRRFEVCGKQLVAASGGAEYLLVPITAYAPLPRGTRPAAFCPVCLERVTLRLGTRNRHHYGHRPDADCAAAGGEGALHLAAKIHLSVQLANGGRGIDIRPVCAGVPDEKRSEFCRAAPAEPWPVEWDEVRVESALPSLRADLMLLREGREVGAIEIHVHHRVDSAKSHKYRGLGVPWIEVPANGVISESGLGWRAGEVLAVLQDSRRDPHAWRCPRHEAMYDGMLEHARTGTHRLAGRVVHVYSSEGGRSTGEMRTRGTTVHMMERREDGRMVEAWLERDDNDSRLGRPVRTTDREQARRELHRQFLGWVKWMREHQRFRVDSPMRWADPAALAGWAKSDAYPERLRWDTHQGDFIAPPNLPATAWPRLPAPDGGADPVTGFAECAWTQTAAGKAPLLHAIHGGVWATLRVQPRGTQAGDGSVGHAAVFLHDGQRWRTAEGAPYVVHRAEPAGDAEGWTAWLQRFAAALASFSASAVLDGSAAVDAIPAAPRS
ncbi:MAG TPA: competence protein CoiA family protein [Longimicrobium sp.]|jgi:hypothetical protein|uniref:competence protein CoiA family protein n=1 Tax=Longimicrobium sp. TaxID=2029185 RepID=UPI002EDAF8A3